MARKRRDADREVTEETPPPAPSPVTASHAHETAPGELRERLRSLRPEDESGGEAKTLAEYLTFWIAGEEYALPVARAREITRCQIITKVPSTPAWVRGVTSIRGSVIPVIDLAPTIDGEVTELSPRAAVLLIDVTWSGEPIGMGLLVEAMGRVVSVDADDLRPVPAFGTRLKAEVLAGLIPLGDRFAPVLDVDRALGPDELMVRSGRAQVAREGGAPPTT